MSTPKATFLGIRHHGPGSAWACIEALEELKPEKILLEAPIDLESMLPFMQTDLRPPVALLAYAKSDPSIVSYLPFCEFSRLYI